MHYHVIFLFEMMHHEHKENLSNILKTLHMWKDTPRIILKKSGNSFRLYMSDTLVTRVIYCFVLPTTVSNFEHTYIQLLNFIIRPSQVNENKNQLSIRPKGLAKCKKWKFLILHMFKTIWTHSYVYQKSVFNNFKFPDPFSYNLLLFFYT